MEWSSSVFNGQLGDEFFTRILTQDAVFIFHKDFRFTEMLKINQIILRFKININRDVED